MSKAVLLSVRPKYCELIANGEKTVEVRKTKPKIPTPFKCYIYQTHPKRSLVEVIRDGNELYGETYHGKTAFITTHKDVSAGSRTFGRWGKVIGEFVCDNITNIVPISSAKDGHKSYFGLSEYGWRSTCLTPDELIAYVGEYTQLYGWHISDLVIYDEPKELSEFWKIKCTHNAKSCGECIDKPSCIKHLTRPPQSWCYVEELT